MSKFLDRLRYFKQLAEPFSDGHGQTLNTNRDWEDGYRSRWQHDKIVRSTHGVNCTGSCSWKIYVKNGLVTWETQQTDYPRTRRTCLTMSLAAARAVPATPGISTAPTA
nr:hypothetical protein PJ912_01220 [Pectobacterium colocasium]